VSSTGGMSKVCEQWNAPDESPSGLSHPRWGRVFNSVLRQGEEPDGADNGRIPRDAFDRG
jgi:hypothetical protein